MADWDVLDVLRRCGFKVQAIPGADHIEVTGRAAAFKQIMQAELFTTPVGAPAAGYIGVDPSTPQGDDTTYVLAIQHGEPFHCHDCGAPMNAGEAKVFTCCDDCWDKAYGKKPAPAAGIWQPFATAPKDRTEILVYREDAGVLMASYRPALAEDGEEDEDNYYWFTVAGEDLPDDDLPTHWMPLPAGPTKQPAPAAGATSRLEALAEIDAVADELAGFAGDRWLCLANRLLKARAAFSIPSPAPAATRPEALDILDGITADLRIHAEALRLNAIKGVNADDLDRWAEELDESYLKLVAAKNRPAPAAGAATPEDADEKRLVTVCAECLQASCWQGIFMCGAAQHTDTLDVPVYELRRLGREHSDYWKLKSEAFAAGAATPGDMVPVKRALLVEAVDDLRCIAERLDHAGHHDKADWANQMAEDFASALAQGGKEHE